jgi:hypothetical protein
MLEAEVLAHAFAPASDNGFEIIETCLWTLWVSAKANAGFDE